MGTILLFRDDAYLRSTPATVAGLDEAGRVILDRTVFYAMGGGQPGDSGALVDGAGRRVPVATAVYGPDKSTILHVLAEGAQPPAPGDAVTAEIDWAVRHARMRIHTALHLLTP
ncbi:alanine--tRNA ligase-related protein, partial [Nostoc sp. NIES-2111]